MVESTSIDALNVTPATPSTSSKAQSVHDYINENHEHLPDEIGEQAVASAPAKDPQPEGEQIFASSSSAKNVVPEGEGVVASSSSAASSSSSSSDSGAEMTGMGASSKISTPGEAGTPSRMLGKSPLREKIGGLRATPERDGPDDLDGLRRRIRELETRIESYEQRESDLVYSGLEAWFSPKSAEFVLTLCCFVFLAAFSYGSILLLLMQFELAGLRTDYGIAGRSHYDNVLSWLASHFDFAKGPVYSLVMFCVSSCLWVVSMLGSIVGSVLATAVASVGIYILMALGGVWAINHRDKGPREFLSYLLCKDDIFGWAKSGIQRVMVMIPILSAMFPAPPAPPEAPRTTPNGGGGTPSTTAPSSPAGSVRTPNGLPSSNISSETFVAAHVPVGSPPATSPPATSPFLGEDGLGSSAGGPRNSIGEKSIEEIQHELAAREEQQRIHLLHKELAARKRRESLGGNPRPPGAVDENPFAFDPPPRS
ncbi:unnamed protein product [Amoebophrya sp. A25]|nr:unnamed protein product [Amoebophrya sp. A25]|eukprot:GSA25T00002916001.1